MTEAYSRFHVLKNGGGSSLSSRSALGIMIFRDFHATSGIPQ